MMHKNAQGDFWQHRETKNVGKFIWDFVDKEKRRRVYLGIHSQQKKFWGEFGCRRSVKIMYMVHGHPMNAQTTLDFDI
jgi:hypothetical protein